MQISDLRPDDAAAIEQAAQALVDEFREHSPTSWPDRAAARAEVLEALQPGKVCRVARDVDGAVLGWVGGQPSYARVWELHPLVVRSSAQRRGIGRALVADLEAQVRARGALTLMLGSDDEDEEIDSDMAEDEDEEEDPTLCGLGKPSLLPALSTFRATLMEGPSPI